MELKEGMYVRTKYGIAKYVHKAVTKATIYYVVDKKIVYENVEGWEDSLLSNEILKASYNIIDLIEVGDYVNGLLVTRICEDTETNEKYINLYGSVSEWEEEDIKSIVTKEQFSQMEYRLGD